MKRLVVFIAVISVFMCSAAYSVEVKFNGDFNIHAGYAANPQFVKDADGGSGAYFSQRFNFWTEFVLNDQISALIDMQMGPSQWGDRANGYAAETNPAQYGTISVRAAQLNWHPTEKVSVIAGISRNVLPSATFGNAVFAARSGGINATYAINDGMALNAIFAQTLVDLTTSVDADNKKFITALSLDIKSIGLTPWFVYGDSGNNADPATSVNPDLGLYGHTATYAGGIAFKIIENEKLFVGLDGTYGMSTSNADIDKPFETSGFVVALKTDYSLDFGKFGFYGWYGSGSKADDATDDNKYGFLPILGADGNFAATTFGFPGSFNFSPMENLISFTPAGMYAVGLGLSDVASMEKMKHKFAVTYMVGTNEKGTPATRYYDGPGLQFLTEEDSVIEVDFTTTYEVSEGLTFAVELGYFVTDFDKEGRGESDDVYVAQFGARYAF